MTAEFFHGHAEDEHMQLTQCVLKRLDKAAGRSVCKLLYVLLCAPFECVCPDTCMCMTMVVSVYFFFFVIPSITSYHCSIMEKCLGNFIAEPWLFRGLGGQGGPVQRAPDDAEKVMELKRG